MTSGRDSGQYSPKTLKARRKQRKNDREKQRRLEINEKFDKLAQLLGLADKAKLEKYNVLAEAVNVINSLKSRNTELRSEKVELRNELVNLTRCLQSAFPVPATDTRISPATPPPPQTPEIFTQPQPRSQQQQWPLPLASENQSQDNTNFASLFADPVQTTNRNSVDSNTFSGGDGFW